MPTVRDVLYRALRKGRVVPEGEIPSAEITADALEEMHDLVGVWETDGIPTTLANSTLDTEVDEPRVVMAALVYTLAVLFAEEVGVPVSPRLMAIQRHYMQKAQGSFINDMRVQFDPALLPTRVYDIDEL